MKNKKSSSAFLWMVSFITVAVVLLIIAASRESTSPKTNREVALTCTTDMATQFHIHPHLEIIVNGHSQEIPANTGIERGCMNAIHTHDATGKLHVEAPEKRDFTLADFFAVWNKTFTKDQVLNYKVDQTHVIRETVNGIEVKAYENTVLRDNDQIVIYYEENKY